MKKIWFLSVGLMITGCTPSIEVTCENIAEMQCDKCTSCAPDAKRAKGLCGISDTETCLDVMTSKCNSGSSELQEPKTSLENCEEELSAMMCSTLFLSETQGHANTVPACVPFL